MKTIGNLLKEARLKKKYSREEVERETKIKKEFIVALEKGEWNELPEFPVTAGFVKNIGGFLGVDKKLAVALLRRDYPPKALPINPKPDVSDKFVWSPKLTFGIAIGFVALIIATYLGFSYLRFVSPPRLEVSEPKEGQVVTQKNLQVTGRTDSDAIVKVNNQPVLVDADGNFSTTLEIFEGTGEVEVKAISRSGKETTVRRKISPKLK